MTNIFIANLDWDVTSGDLQATFSAFGEVHLAHVVFDAKTKKSKGFGYVEMLQAEDAISAIQALNGIEVNGRNLDVKIASPKANRPKPDPNKPKPKPLGLKTGPFVPKPRFNPNNSNSPRPSGSGGYQAKQGGYQGGNNTWNRSENTGGNTTPSESKPDAPSTPERVLRPRKRLD